MSLIIMIIGLLIVAFVDSSESFNFPLLMPEQPVCQPKNQLMYTTPNIASLGMQPMGIASGTQQANMAQVPTPFISQPPGNAQFASSCDNSMEREAFKRCVSEGFKRFASILENCRNVLGPYAKECCIDDKCLSLLKRPETTCNQGAQKQDKTKCEAEDDKSADDKAIRNMMHNLLDVLKKMAKSSDATSTINGKEDRSSEEVSHRKERDSCDDCKKDTKRSKERKRPSEYDDPPKKRSYEDSLEREPEDSRRRGKSSSRKPLEEGETIEKTKIIVIPSKQYEKIDVDRYEDEEDSRMIYQGSNRRKRRNEYSSFVEDDYMPPKSNSSNNRHNRNRRPRKKPKKGDRMENSSQRLEYEEPIEHTDYRPQDNSRKYRPRPRKIEKYPPQDDNGNRSPRDNDKNYLPPENGENYPPPSQRDNRNYRPQPTSNVDYRQNTTIGGVQQHNGPSSTMMPYEYNDFERQQSITDPRPPNRTTTNFGKQVNFLQNPQRMNNAVEISADPFYPANQINNYQNSLYQPYLPYDYYRPLNNLTNQNERKLEPNAETKKSEQDEEVKKDDVDIAKKKSKSKKSNKSTLVGEKTSRDCCKDEDTNRECLCDNGEKKDDIES